MGSPISFGRSRSSRTHTAPDGSALASRRCRTARPDGFREINPRATVTLALDWAEQRDTASGLASANTNLSATWTKDITTDWALDLGYTRRLSDQAGVGRGQSDAVFVELRRTFSLRP